MTDALVLVTIWLALLTLGAWADLVSYRVRRDGK